MFLEIQVGNSALFTSGFGWHASDVNLPPIGIICPHLVCPTEWRLFLFTSGIANLSLYEHCTIEQHILDTNAWKQMSKAATYV